MRASTPFGFLALLVSVLAVGGCPQKRSARDGGIAVTRDGGTVPRLPSKAADTWPRPSSTQRAGGAITIRLRSEPTHLNLLLQPGREISRITLDQIFEALLREDPHTYRLTGVLARTWSLSADRRVVTLRLREGVHWHDGKPFTAADVQFTLATVLDKRSGADALRGNVKDLAKVEVSGDHTIVLHYRRPYFHALHALASIPILPKHLYHRRRLKGHPANRAPIGTGPYQFSAWRRGREIVLRRWPRYWGEKARIATLRYRVVRQPEIAVALVRRGEVDVDERAGNDQWLEAATDRRLRARARRLLLYPPNYAFRVYNTRRPPLQDRRVRMALTFLTDRKTVLREVHRGLHRPVVAHYPVESPCHDPKRRPHPFDPARARKLLTAAGYGPKRPLTLTWLIPTTSKTLVPEARIFQGDAAKAGVVVKVETVDWPTFISRLRKGSFDMAALAWFHGVEDDPFFVFHSSQAGGGLNYGAFKSSTLDALMEKTRTVFARAERTRLCRRIEGLLHHEQPYTFLYQLATPLLVSRRLDGIYPSLAGLQYRDFWLKR